MIVALVVALLGCGHRLGHPAVHYAAAEPVPMVHTSNDTSRWYVAPDHGALGERVWFFDTGYSYTTCDDDFVAELGLEPRGHVTVHGEAGEIPARKVRLPPMELGGHPIRRLVCVVRDLGSTSSIEDPPEVDVAGVLGADVLRRFDVEIDPANARLVLHDPRRRPPLRRDAPGVVPLGREYGFGLRFTVPVDVGDQRIWPVVDTGASGTHVDGARLGLEPTIVHEQVAVRASGEQGQVVQDLILYQVPEVRIDEHVLGPVLLTDRPRPPWVPGLLGLNVLGTFRQEYDFDRGLVRLTRVDMARIPSWRDYVASRQPPPAEAETATAEP